MINFASFIGIENNMELLREILFVLMLHYQSGVGYAIDMHNKLFGENWSKQVKAYDRLKKEKEREAIRLIVKTFNELKEGKK